MLWHQVGIHFDLGELVGVSLEVNLEIAFGSEPIATDIALVGSLSSMGSYMDLQGGIGTKNFATIATSVLEKGLAFLVELGVLADTEIGQVVGQQTLTSTVQDPLGSLLQ